MDFKQLTVAEIDDLISHGQFDEAEEALISIYQKNPDFADICNRLGQIYYLKGEYTSAREFLDKAVRLNPDYTEASLNLAVTLNEMKQYGRAKEVIEKAQLRATRKRTALEPFIAGKLANKHKEIGDIYRELGMFLESIVEYRKALNVSPGFPDIQVKLAVTLRELGMTDEALDILTRATEHRPDYMDARIQLGITYFSRGFLDRAKEQWEQVLKTDPSHTKALMYMSFLNKNTGMASNNSASIT
ncbi:MAG: tetratricopeptide repeat protein [bacterium]|nr:tetratricopeptide repeat protein [bacterium]MDT8365238.1 tetratricopeptide repeat protein [bacterium]